MDVLDRVLITTTTVGTGTYSCGAAINGYLDLSGAGAISGHRYPFVAVDSLDSPTQYEIFEGVATSGSPWTLTRASIKKSSSGGTAVNWAAGTKYLFCIPHAALLVLFDENGKLNLPNVLNEAKGADLAAAATTDIANATGNFVAVTGAATITALGTVQAGARRRVRFTGTPTLTYNAASLILPGSRDIAVEAGDVAEFVSLGAGSWVCIDYQPAGPGPHFYSRRQVDFLMRKVVSGITATLWWELRYGDALPSWMTFTRATSATYVNALGQIATAAAGTLRYDFDPVTGEFLGCLIEETRTNLLTYSAQLDNAAWTKGNATVIADAVAAPDGVTAADKLVESTANGQHQSYQQVSIGVGTARCYSVFVKAAGRMKGNIAIDNGGADLARVTFDLSSATVGAVTTGGAITGVTSGIRSYGNGWYRVWVAGVLSGGTVGNNILRIDAGGGDSYIGDGASGLYVWGQQSENGLFPTSYMPTTSASATRNADVLTVAVGGIPFNPVEGTIYIHGDMLSMTGSPWIVGIDDSTSNNNILIYATGGTPYGFVNAGGVNQANVSSGVTVAVNTAFKIALAFRANDFAIVSNGNAPGVDAAGSVPTVTTVRIFGHGLGTLGSGHVRHLAIFPRRLTNADLQTITS
ncbi:MAG: phage head spike fiber domain-containing protein [Bacteroidota bacterium]